MTSGNNIEDEINSQISKLDRMESKLSSTLEKYEEQISSLTDERETSYANLAQTYLPELDAQAIKQTLKDVQGEVQRIFNQKQARRKELETLMQDSTQKKANLEERLGKVTSELNEKVSERDRRKKEIAKELSGRPDYPAFVADAEKAKANLDNNKARVKEVEAEAKNKLPVYQHNKIFTYLLKKGFGTEEYANKGIINKLDNWVARKVDYKDSKKNYDFLKAMPELMALEVEHRKEELEIIVSKIKKMEKEVAENHGLPEVMEEGMKLGKTREDLIKGIEKLNSDYESYASERKASDSTKDSYHQAAIQKLKSYLKGDSIAELKQMARKTPGTEDDKLVDRIEDIDGNIRQLKDKSKETQSEREELVDKLKGLKKIMEKFRSSDYESSRSYFDSDLNINTIILAYLAGKLSEQKVWGEIENNQHFKIEESHTSYTHTTDYSSHHSSGSDFGGGGFSSGGGFGGGGFSSGKGF